MTLHAIQVLKTARNLIEAGWVQSTYARTAERPDDDLDFMLVAKDNHACYCTVGAVLKAAHPHSDQLFQHLDMQTDRKGFEPFTILEEQIRELYPIYDTFAKEVSHIAWWNDDEGRTQEQVLALFDAAIQKATERYTESIKQ